TISGNHQPPTLTLDFTFPAPISRRRDRREILRRRLHGHWTAGYALLRQSGSERRWYAPRRRRSDDPSGG
ncbi:MAG: hypothetical protein J7M34_12695, partial [Anaerolineae bacterium]|nr:hypothetical protein [Anaerolineae bacterium]